MLAKVIALGRDPRRSRSPGSSPRCASIPILGIRTNIPFLLRILEHPRFRSGTIDTGFLDDGRRRRWPTRAPTTSAATSGRNRPHQRCRTARAPRLVNGTPIESVAQPRRMAHVNRGDRIGGAYRPRHRPRRRRRADTTSCTSRDRAADRWAFWNGQVFRALGRADAATRSARTRARRASR